MERNRHGRRGGRPAPLDDLDAEAVRCGPQRQAQRRRRSVLRGLQRTQREQQRLGGLRGQMQPPQRGRLHVLQPDEQRAASARAQDLLGRPQRVGRLRRTQPEHAFERHAEIREARRVRQIRRLHERDRPAPERTERRPQQTQFAAPGLAQ